MATTSTLTAGAIAEASADWTTTGGSDGAVLNSDDGDTSYAGCNDNAAAEHYVLSNLPAEAAAIVVVDITTWKGRKSSTNNRPTRVGLSLSGNNTPGVTRTLSTGSYETFSELNLSRPGGGVWSVSDINSTNLFVQTTTTVADGAVRITFVKTDVQWDAAPGGFAFLVASWLGPVIGASLSLRDAFAIVTEINRLHRGKHHIDLPDAPRVLADLRAPRPCYVFL